MAVEGVDQSRHKLGTAGPERMTEGDGAAVDVEAGRVGVELLEPGERDGGEGFVDFVKIAGSPAVTVRWSMRAMGLRPCAFTARSLATSTPLAPSQICEALPAVMTPSGTSVFKEPRPSSEAS